MHFSYANNGSGSKASKFAVVAAVHVAVGVLFVHSLNTRHVSLSRLQDQVLVLIEPQPSRPAVADPPPQAQAPANASPGQMRSALFADANGCALPAYPRSAILNEETGTTMLALLVGPDGRVTSARVQHTSGYRDLDHAAIQALSLCRFKPATNNGVPEAGWAQLAYVWKLD